MATSTKKKIRAYCEAQGIFIPAGFDRHSASRYAIIRRDLDPPKLVAKTWFNQTDVIYYVERTLQDEITGDINGSVDILDFKEERKLAYTETGKLASCESIVVTDD